MRTAAEKTPDETIAAEARVYRDKDGCLWLDPFGDGNLFAFDRQCRTAMGARWGTTPLELVAAQFEIAELVPVEARPDDWGVRWRFQDHNPWVIYEYVNKDIAVDQRNRLRKAGFQTTLWVRPGMLGPGEWRSAEDQA